MSGPARPVSTMLSTRQLIAADLRAATGRSGLRGMLAAALLEPGFATLLLHRWGVALQQRGLLRSAKILWRWNVWSSACHLHLDASIGPGLLLPHPTGVVIGRGVTVGSDVTLYQHVTLGRSRREDRYPSIGDGAVIYPGAVVAGAVVVGRRAVVGAGAIVLHDVPDDAVVAGNPARSVSSSRAHPPAATP
jgi:serine O-acetyltransferase